MSRGLSSSYAVIVCQVAQWGFSLKALVVCRVFVTRIPLDLADDLVIAGEVTPAQIHVRRRAHLDPVQGFAAEFFFAFGGSAGGKNSWRDFSVGNNDTAGGDKRFFANLNVL